MSIAAWQKHHRSGRTPPTYPPAQVYTHPDYFLGMQVRIDPGVRNLFPACACAGQVGEVVQGFFWEGSGVCGYQPDLVPVKYQRRIYAIPQQFVCPLSCPVQSQEHVPTAHVTKHGDLSQ